MDLRPTPSEHKVAFESAYENLAQTVRNFSREKLGLEETIRGLSEQVAALRVSLGDKNQENETVVEENRRLRGQHDDDISTRCSMDSLLQNTAEKHGVLNQTLEQFQTMEQQVDARSQESVDFVESLKLRQLQLFDWIAALKITHQQEMDSSAKLLEDSENNVSQKEAVIQDLNQKAIAVEAETNTQIDILKQLLSTADANLIILQSKFLESENNVAQKEATIQDLTQKAITTEAETNTQIDILKQLLSTADANIILLQSKFIETENNVAQKEAMIQDLNQKMAAAEAETLTQIDILKQLLSTADANLILLQSKFIESENNVAQKEAMIQDLTQKATATEAETNTQIDILKQLLSTADANLTILQSKFLESENNVTQKEALIKDLIQKAVATEDQTNTQIDILKQLLSTAEANIVLLQSKFVESENNVAQKEAKIQDLNQKMATAEAETLTQIDILKQLLSTADANLILLQSKFLESENNVTQKEAVIQDLTQKATATEAETNTQIDILKQLLSTAEANLILIQSKFLESENNVAQQETMIQDLTLQMAANEAETLTKIDQKEAMIQELTQKMNAAEAETRTQIDILKQLLSTAEANVILLQSKFVELENNVAERDTLIEDLTQKMNAAQIKSQKEIEGYKKALSTSDATVSTLQAKLLSTADSLQNKVRNIDDLIDKVKETRAPTRSSPSPFRSSPFRATASMTSLPRSAPSSILKSNRSSMTSLGQGAAKRVSWSDVLSRDQERNDPKKHKLYEPLIFSSSSSEDEDPKKASSATKIGDTTYAVPLKRSRLSDKENCNSR